jgi:hypothetical protein
MKHKHSRAFLLPCASRAQTAATVVLGFTAPARAHETLKQEAPKPLLAPTPPMGWNSVAQQVRGSCGGTVAPHGVVMVRITPFHEWKGKLA